MAYIKQHFAKLSGGDIHYRYAGKGAPVLLIHGSPNNSSTLIPLIEHLAQHFLVIAPDTPGNGDSEPLPHKFLPASAYADVFNELLDHIGLQQVGVYGFHTGAVFAAELAKRHHTRVSAVVCDGFPLWSAAEAALLDENYYTSIAPKADGSHLATLWSRLIDQLWHFPWHIREPQNRISYDLSNTSHIQTRCMEMLLSGDNYQSPYAAALHADGHERLQDLKVPTLLTCASNDVLITHLDRVTATENIDRQITADAAETYRITEQWFAKYIATTGELTPVQSEHRFVDIDGGQIYINQRTTDAGLWLHDAGRSHHQHKPNNGFTYMDLPGHGLSSAPWPRTYEQSVELMHHCISTLNINLASTDIQGEGLGQQLADSLTQYTKPIPRQLDVTTPDIKPRWDGAHLLAAWHFCRFRNQYQQWDQRTPETRSSQPIPSAETLQRQLVDLLRTGQQTLDRTLGYS